MNFKNNKKIYKKCKSKKVTVNYVCEVGVYLPETSNIIDFITDGIKTTLVEPDTKNIDAINKYFSSKKNITLYPFAIFDYNGTIELFQRNASTFVSPLKTSPSLINEKYIPDDKDKFTVICKKFNEIDDGTIELLSVDIEGCEWYVLKHLKSRPKIISLETHGKSYTNPYIGEILSWIKENDYKVWYKDKSDTVFIKNGLFRISLLDKIKLIMYEFYLKWRKIKYGYIKKH